MKIIKNPVISASMLALVFMSGCQNYEARHDGVTVDAGNHLATNQAQMVADPWKRNAYNTHTHADGKRSAEIVEKYRSQHSPKEGAAGGAAPIAPPVAPPSQAN